jgi:hypothetical protein
VVEEPWEGEVSAALGALPAVEPPEGFMVAALDHRPLHAGRVMVGLVATVVVLFAATMVGGITVRSLGVDASAVTATVTATEVRPSDDGAVPGTGSEGGAEEGEELRSVWDRAQVVVDAVTRQLGFPATDTEVTNRGDDDAADSVGGLSSRRGDGGS